MTQYTILGRLRLLIDIEDDEAAKALLPWCAAAFAQLTPQVKPGRGNDPRLDQAGAALALCMLLQSGGSGGDDVASFKAGDITITKRDKDGKDRLSQAMQAKKAAFEEARELLRDTGFFVGEVRFKNTAPSLRPRKPAPTHAKGA